MVMVNVLYIHGMGGGSDSRIPSILRDALAPRGIAVICRTYDFDPEIAGAQIFSWVAELKPDLVIGESLGSLHTLKITGIPHLFVSPALNASFYFSIFSVLTRIPGMTKVFDRIYRPREGDRQPLHFIPETLKKYRRHREEALAESAVDGGSICDFAFFGTRDHYRRSGVVSIRTWRKHFGEGSYALYEGTHFMEEEFIHKMLIPKIIEFFQDKP